MKLVTAKENETNCPKKSTNTNLHISFLFICIGIWNGLPNAGERKEREEIFGKKNTQVLWSLDTIREPTCPNIKARSHDNDN